MKRIAVSAAIGGFVIAAWLVVVSWFLAVAHNAVDLNDS